MLIFGQSNGLVLLAAVLSALVLTVLVPEAPVLVALVARSTLFVWEISTMHKNMAFTLFCCEFENVVNRAFLVLIFWGKNLVSANFYAFCNYAALTHFEA